MLQIDNGVYCIANEERKEHHTKILEGQLYIEYIISIIIIAAREVEYRKGGRTHTHRWLLTGI